MTKAFFLLLAALALTMPPLKLQAGDHSELWTLLRDGESAARQANEQVTTNPQKARDLYLGSALNFERIARDGAIENGKLYYNLGNIYFRLGDLGRSILNYRKAQKFIPHNVNLRQNLDYARSRCLDKVEIKPQTKVLQTVFSWHYDLSLWSRAVFFVVVFNLTWIALGAQLFRKTTWLPRVALGCALLSLFLIGSLSVEAFLELRNRSGVILASEVIARKGDSVTFEPTFKEPLHPGTEFMLVEERAGWYHIELADGRRCWIPDSAAGII